MKMLKRTFFIIVICICSFWVYYSYFASKPEKTIEAFVLAINEMDYDKLINCYEPKLQNASEGIMKISSSLLGINISNVLQTEPILSKIVKDDYTTYDVYDVSVAEYQGKYLPEQFKIDSKFEEMLGCFLADLAVVDFVILTSDSCEKIECRVILRNYNFRWLIPIEQELIIIK